MKLPISTIVAAVHLEDDLADGVLKTAIALAGRLGADLHVIDAYPALKSVGYPYARRPEKEEAQEHSKARDEALHRLEARVKALNGEATVAAPVGTLAESIRLYIEANSADLLVIGTHQKTFWDKLLAGSVSSQLAHDAPCAVMLVPPGFAARVAHPA